MPPATSMPLNRAHRCSTAAYASHMRNKARCPPVGPRTGEDPRSTPLMRLLYNVVRVEGCHGACGRRWSWTPVSLNWGCQLRDGLLVNGVVLRALHLIIDIPRIFLRIMRFGNMILCSCVLYSVIFGRPIN